MIIQPQIAIFQAVALLYCSFVFQTAKTIDRQKEFSSPILKTWNKVDV